MASRVNRIGRVIHLAAGFGLMAWLPWLLVPLHSRALALADAPPKRGTVTPPNQMNAAKVMGVESCVECHKPEVAAWKVSQHATKFEQLAQNPNAAKYAAAMNVTVADITQSGLCVHCHGLKAEATTHKYVTGVSCESCHGAAGGEPGWMNPHASYGANGLKRDQETPEHRTQRLATVDQLGMIRPGRPYELAKNCVGCHLVPDEDLVNKANHHAGSGNFELVSWIEGDVCHNMFLDPTVNHEAPTIWKKDTGRTAAQHKRLLYVLGQLAQMEMALRNIANSKADGAYSQAMKDFAGKARGNLSDLVDAVPALADLKPVMAGYRKIALKLKPQYKTDLLAFADQVEAAAQKVVRSATVYSGKELDDVIPKKGNGVRYKP